MAHTDQGRSRAPLRGFCVAGQSGLHRPGSVKGFCFAVLSLADQSGLHRPGSVKGIAPSRFHRPRVGGATTERLQNPNKSRSDRPPLTLRQWRRD